MGNRLMNRIPYTCATVLSCVGLFSTQVCAYGCVDHVIVRPVGTITNLDPVQLKIRVNTVSSPPIHAQPTELSRVGNQFQVRMWIFGGSLDTPGSLTDTIELGPLDPGTYRYSIELHTETDPGTYTAEKTFCVEGSECADAACRCPAFSPQYSIINLGTLGGSSSWGQAINNRGDVAGRSYGPNGQHAFVWQDGTMTDLGTLEANDIESSGYGIGNNGDVVGYSYGPSSAVLWRDGEIIELGTLGGDSIAYAVNDAGQIVGRSYVGQYDSHAVLWQDGELIDLTTTFDAPIIAARDINALGQIVGDSVLLDPDGTITDLGSLGGGYTAAQAVNDHGQVVGHSHRANDIYSHGFVWTDGVMTDLGTVGGFSRSVAYGINNAGQIIGGGSGPRPWCGSYFIYESGTEMGRLRDLIPIGSGWTHLWPFDINELGQIAGTASLNGETRAFLMTPISESADLNGNGDVDLRDHSLFANCMSGRNVHQSPADCLPLLFHRADIDGDKDVDLTDHAMFTEKLDTP